MIILWWLGYCEGTTPETKHLLSQTESNCCAIVSLSDPPHAEVSGYNGDWYVDLETAALRCVSGGNPKPQSFTWIRYSQTCRPLWLSGRPYMTNRLMCLITVTFFVCYSVVITLDGWMGDLKSVSGQPFVCGSNESNFSTQTII